jgi:hypothetical protein
MKRDDVGLILFAGGFACFVAAMTWLAFNVSWVLGVGLVGAVVAVLGWMMMKVHYLMEYGNRKWK